MDKLERLLNLTMTLLQTPRPLTAAEIRERIPGYPESDASFRRAFERDKESLRDMGVPISMEPITHSDPPADGYRIHEDDYYLRDPGFEPDELAALHLAASAVRLDSASGVEGLWKLGSTTDDGDPTAGGSATEPLAALPGDPNLGPLFAAVAERRPAGFRYNDRDRTIDPYRLDFQRGRWYLTGFDREKAEERNFRVDRIDGAVVVGTPRSFERPETAVRGGPAQPWQFGEGDAVTAHLLVDRDHAGWVRGHLGSDAVVSERDDGSVVFRVAVTNWPAFRSFVLTFLEHAEIVSPPELRQQMIDFLERAVTRLTADDRMQRMLSIIPWVAARDGVPVDEVCERFQIDRKALLQGFDILAFVGVHPYTPDTQIDAVVEGDLVFVRMPQWFDRPLRLTPEQGLSLVASATSLLSVPGADPEGPLARGIAKIAASLGADRDTIDVSLGAAAAETLAALQEATEAHREVEIDYYTYGRDEVTTRVIDPHRLYADQGNWYVAAHCHLAGGDRIFRVDRINRASVRTTTFEPPDEPPTMGVFRPAPDDPRVTLRLRPAARWVAEQYPTEALVTHDDGTVDVTLAIAATAWLERLLVRLGPDVEVVDGPEELAAAGSRAARRILARYRGQ